MEPSELKEWLERWGLNQVQGSKVLKIQKTKMSDYVRGLRKVPPYIAAHIKTFDELAKTKAKKIIEKRLNEIPKGD